MRSEYSTVSGKKPLLCSRAVEQTVTSTTVPPHWAHTAPSAWLAMRPVSKMYSLPRTLHVTLVGEKISLFKKISLRRGLREKQKNLA